MGHYPLMSHITYTGEIKWKTTKHLQSHLQS